MQIRSIKLVSLKVHLSESIILVILEKKGKSDLGVVFYFSLYLFRRKPDCDSPVRYW